MRRTFVACLLFLPAAACGGSPDPGLRSEEVSFRNRDVALSGTLFLPAGHGPHPAVVVFHAAGGGTRSFHAYRHLASELPGAGFATLLFDRRGSGESGGDFETATFEDLAADGLAAYASAFLPRSGTLPTDPRGTKWRAEMDYEPPGVLARVRVPIAFFFAEEDPWVPVDESIAAIRNATASNPDVTIRKIAGADHLMETGVPDSSGPTSVRYLALLLDWIRRQGGQAGKPAG